MPSPTAGIPVVNVARSGSTLVDALVYGTAWTGGVVTYSFPESNSLWSSASNTGYGPSSGSGEPWTGYFSPLSSSDRGFFNTALQKWSAVANLQIGQVADSSTFVGDIRAAYTVSASHTDAQAWAYLPSNTATAGDVWFNANSTSGSDVWTAGTYPNMALLHELGHALGLKHPFEGATTLPSAWDTQLFTVMSYSSQPGYTNSYMTMYPTTPMILDVLAIQYIYGANYSYHNTSDTYTYGDSVKYNETIWDGGGSDTISYSGSISSSIDLREGHGSTIGQRVYWGTSRATEVALNNVWIAYGVAIENAIGGQSVDAITGNDLDNALMGRGGNDILDGGAGTDTAVFTGRYSDYTITRSGTTYTVTDKVSGRDGSDQVTNIEQFRFSDGTLAAASLIAYVPTRAESLSILGVYRGFFGTAAPAAIYTAAAAVVGSASTSAYAIAVGNNFSSTTSDALSSQVMGNFGMSTTTLGTASYTALKTAVAQIFNVYPTARGQVVLNIANLLGGLENDSVFGAVARTFNSRVLSDYSSAPAIGLDIDSSPLMLVGVSELAPGG
ncbi:MAG: M10 family metallopeptidase C-terminal domain-containing protein [Burkholderiales bacterium]|nr:M10 family metallopeptidase C-terminal domain-containing protein [Burkholderiales bacterium]